MTQGTKFVYKGFTATVLFDWGNGLTQFSFTDANGNVNIVRARIDCDCAAATEGKWADVHSAGCSSVKA